MTQTFPALLSVRKLSSTGEGSGECLHLWELLECSICDPRVGVRPGPPVICASFCDMVFEACSEAYFSIDMKTQVDPFLNLCELCIIKTIFVVKSFAIVLVQLYTCNCQIMLDILWYDHSLAILNIFSTL